MLPTGFRTFHFVSFLYVFFFSFLFLLFRFFSHYFVFVFLRFVFFSFLFVTFLLVFFSFFFLSVSFRFFSFFSVSQFTGTLNSCGYDKYFPISCDFYIKFDYFALKCLILGYIMPGIVAYILYNVMDYPCANFYTILSSNLHTTDIFQFLAIFAQNLAISPKNWKCLVSQKSIKLFRISET